MASKCKKCKREHEPVSLAEWSWQVRDMKPKPEGAAGWVLWMLASRMDPKTGCGYASEEVLAGDAGVSVDTVRRVLRWARQHFIVHRAGRGHRAGDGTVRASQWQLASQSQPGTRVRLRSASTVHEPVLNRADEPSQPGTGAAPRETFTRETSLKPAAGDDDPLLVLLRQSVPDAEMRELSELIGWTTGEGKIRNVRAYLRAAFRNGDGPSLIGEVRTEMAAQNRCRVCGQGNGGHADRCPEKYKPRRTTLSQSPPEDGCFDWD